MFYKLENSYNDYFLVKRNSNTKQEYLENILNNIQFCNYIKLVNPIDEEFEKIQENGSYEIDLKIKRIKVLPNELAMLSALMELNNFEIHLKEEYNLIRNSMPYLLNTAYDMENIEVLRDFNAWSWNTVIQEIKDVNVNLIYQNLRIALDEDIFNRIQKNDTDIIEYIQKKLLELYNKEIVEEFMFLIFKISILIYINISENEKNRLLKEKENLNIELNEISDKKSYVDNITKNKKKLTNELKKIDLILNNRELLLSEYENRNKGLAEYNKIFSLSHLVEKIQRERTKILNKIKKCNKQIEPKTYLENKNRLKNDNEILKEIESANIYKYIEKLQKLFINEILLHRINNSNTRNELIDCMYELRYYNFIPYNNKELIKDIEGIKEYLEKPKEILIKKLYDNKIINTISTSEKNDIKIIKNIFDLKIIDMEKIYIKIRKKDDKYIISTYDEKETLEKEFDIDLKFNAKDKIKLNKKIKLFKFER